MGGPWHTGSGKNYKEPERNDAQLPLLPLHALIASQSSRLTNQDNVYTVEFGVHINECVPRVFNRHQLPGERNTYVVDAQEPQPVR